MSLRLLLVLVMLVSLSTPAQAGDRTSALLAALDQCPGGGSAPRLDILLALADGRSAAELAAILQAPRRCLGHVSTFGDGDDELVFIGGTHGYVADGTDGALLWVDRGWWRIAALPFGWITGTREVIRRGADRELLAGICVSGSAGCVGVLGVRITGATASVTLRLEPGGEVRTVRMVDPDHVYIEGRLTRDPLFTWNSHPAWPYGAQWLFERRGDSFVQVASRQTHDPYYLATGFYGALFDRDAARMMEFATADAVLQGLALPRPDRRTDPLVLLADRDFFDRELMSWSALPESVRTSAPAGPVWGLLRGYDDASASRSPVLLRFDRRGEGWVITDVRLMFVCEGCGPRLVPF